MSNTFLLESLDTTNPDLARSRRRPDHMTSLRTHRVELLVMMGSKPVTPRPLSVSRAAETLFAFFSHIMLE